MNGAMRIPRKRNLDKRADESVNSNKAERYTKILPRVSILPRAQTDYKREQI